MMNCEILSPFNFIKVLSGSHQRMKLQLQVKYWGLIQRSKGDYISKQMIHDFLKALGLFNIVFLLLISRTIKVINFSLQL